MTSDRPRPGMVRLTPSRGQPLTMILAGPPDRGGGVGGYEPIERQGRRPAKWWKGSPDDTMGLDLIIDVDAVGGPSVERRLRVLRDMGLPGDDAEPPSIRVDGDVWTSDGNLRWVMADLSFGERLFNPDGTLRRQQVRVDLEGFRALPSIRAAGSRGSPAAGRKAGSAGATHGRRTVVTRASDTLRSVAARELDDQARWKDLVRWNKTKLGVLRTQGGRVIDRTSTGIDPDMRLRPGTHLVVRR